MKDFDESVIGRLRAQEREIERLKVKESGKFIPLTSPLTSTSWDGDSFSTTAKTKIDLSSVFSVPAGVKAVLAKLAARDSGSAAGAGYSYYVGLSPNNTSGSSPVILRLDFVSNDEINEMGGVICPCDANGDIYYEVAASGAGTMDIWLQIWGYWL